MGPKLDPYRAPIWAQHGTLLQIPHHSHMGSPYWTHIETHLGLIWVQHALLAWQDSMHVLITCRKKNRINSNIGKVETSTV